MEDRSESESAASDIGKTVTATTESVSYQHLTGSAAMDNIFSTAQSRATCTAVSHTDSRTLPASSLLSSVTSTVTNRPALMTSALTKTSTNGSVATPFRSTTTYSTEEPAEKDHAVTVRQATAVTDGNKDEAPRVGEPTSSLLVTALSTTDGKDKSLQEDNSHKLLQAVRSTNLPYPLPVPTYSQAVQAARASGNVASERATIIRETVKFFLQHKYWWTSDDYDRIAELVVNEFPELRDPFTWPSQPCYSKVRLDLSMCARNIRRIAKNQEKRKGSPRHRSSESLEVPAKASESPVFNKAKKGGGKTSLSGRRSGAQLSGSPSMVLQSVKSQLLPHTAKAAHNCPITSNPHLDQKQHTNVPSLLTSTGSVSSTSSPTVLPPVAHFLGHAPTHCQGGSSIVFPSLVPATTAAPAAALSVSANHSARTPAAAVDQWSAKASDSALDNIGTISSAACLNAQLPEPLPVPPYSDKVMKAKKMGITKYERPLIIRETVIFFLSLKYWWSSLDYDRISDFVVDYFPDLRDPVSSPNIPPNRRVRSDLSQTARNIRRREVMLKRRDSRSPEDRFAAVGTVTSLPSLCLQQPATNFCNELLAAASIIESRTAAMQNKDSTDQHEVLSKEGVSEHRLLEQPTVPTAHSGEANRTYKSAVPKEKIGSKIMSDYTHVHTTPSVPDSGLSNLANSKNKEGHAQVKPSADATSVTCELAVVKHEVEEDDLEQQQARQAHWQTLSTHMSQALSMQALSAHMSQALSAAQMPEHIGTSHLSPHATLTQSSVSPGSHQSNPASSSANLSSLSLQQLSQAYSLAASAAAAADGSEGSSHVDRMSAMAMWRSTCLPDPLPTPPFSLNVLRARDAGNTASARPRIIRETTQFFLAMKMWWTTQDYERIAELVLQHFPALKSVHNIKKDLGTCARNMRRRLPLNRCKPSAYSKQWSGSHSPPSGTLNEFDSSPEGSSTKGVGLTLGELATMASLHEAVGQRGQDKGAAKSAGIAGIGALTEEQRQALLAHSVYEQSTRAWNALYQQQFSVPTTDSVVPQARSAKRSLSDTTVIKADEPSSKSVSADPFRKGTEESAIHPSQASGSRRHSTDVTARDKLAEGAKLETGLADHTQSAVGASKPSDMYYGLTEQLTAHTPSAREQMKMSSDAVVTNVITSTTAVSGSLIQAHLQPTQAHAQSSVHIHHQPDIADEAPMNLTCSSDVLRQQQQYGEDREKADPLKATAKHSRSDSIETFSAREQVWFPHGSPWKKGGQTLFKALPNPLPIPKYSQKLLKAREEGLAYRHRSEIIRETARFFLGFKYWWSSADYSRISELVVSQFPDLKDPVSHPGQPAFRRIQRDLSMCARNLRRKNTRHQKLSLSDVARAPKKAKVGSEKKAVKDSQAGMKLSAKLQSGRKDAHSEIFQTSDSTAMLPAASLRGSTVTRPKKKTAVVSSTSAQPLLQTISSVTAVPAAVDSSRKTDSSMVPQGSGSASAVEPLLATCNKTKTAKSGASLNSNPLHSEAEKSSGVHPSLLSSTIVAQSTLPSLTTSVSAHLLSKANTMDPKQYYSASLKEESAGEPRLSHSSHKTASRSGSATGLEQHKKSSKHSEETNLTISADHDALKAAVPAAQSSYKSVLHMSGECGGGGVEHHDRWTSDLGAQSLLPSSRHVQSHSNTPASLRQTSNTTAIVTPRRTEAHVSSTNSTAAEGSVSQKVYIDPDHGSELQMQLTKLWQEGKFFDASLEVDGYRLPVHKLVLLAASPYLQSTFRHANPTSHLEVNLPRETAVNAAQDFLKYVYQGVLHVGADTVHALRRIAAMLQIDKLLMYCDDYIRLLTTGAAFSLSQPDKLPQAAQVPRVSINLRDLPHSHHHQLSSSESSFALGHQELAHKSPVTSSSDAEHRLRKAQERVVTSRKRRAVTTSLDHSSPTVKRSCSVSEMGEQSSGLLTEHVQVYEHIQPDSVPVSEHARHAQYAAQKAVAQHTRDGHMGLLEHSATDNPSDSMSALEGRKELELEAGGYYHKREGEQRLVENQEQVFGQHTLDHELLAGDGMHHTAIGEQDAGVISHTFVSVSRREDGSLEAGQEAVLEAGPEAVQLLMAGEGVQLEGDVLVQAMDDDMVAMLPQDDQTEHRVLVSQVDMLDRGSLTTTHLDTLACDDADVVEEVVVGAGDLLQDVEVAACETVECSFLPQTYCSSPEQSGSPTRSPSSSPSLSSLKWSGQQEGSQEDFQHQSVVATYIIPPATSESMAESARLLLTEVGDSTVRCDQDETSMTQGSLLPQTYCSSPEHSRSADK